jgi:uncharacterized membrane-anchored protein
MRRMTSRSLVAVVLLLAGAAPALAKVKRKEAKAAPEVEASGPAEQAPKGPEPKYHPLVGPQKVDLGHDLEIDLSSEMLFLERKEAKELMESSGNIISDNFLGLVAQKDRSWFVTVSYYEEGYVKDNEAADFRANDILDNIREGNEEANEVRKQRGFKPLAIDGWTESPRYERALHHLVWGIKVSDPESSSINFYTRILGRRGYVALNLIDDPGKIEASKKESLAVLKATTFRSGARYEDFDSKKDKVAEYGLAALVAGGAGAAALKLAKVGLLAKFGGKLIALIIAGKKAIVVLILAVGAGIKRFFGKLTGKKQEVAYAPPPPAPDDVPPGPPPGNLPPPGAPPAT